MSRTISRGEFLQRVAGSVAAVAAVPLLGACGGSSGTSSSKTGLTFLNQSRGQAKALTALAETYTKTTGVKITIDTAGPADFKAKLQSSSQSGDMPDIYSALGDRDEMAPYYKAGWAMDLTEELSSGWKKDFAPAALQLSAWPQGNAAGVPAGTYSAHWELGGYAILANPAHFAKAGVDLSKPPATMAEFIEQLKKVKGTGAAPFLVASTQVSHLVQTYVSNWLTDAEIDATLAGKASFKTDPWRNALQLLVDLRDAGVIANNALPGGSDANPTVEKGFFNVQDLAAIFDGSFGIGVGRATAPDFTTFTSFQLPKASDAKHAPRSSGGPSKGAAVNPKSKNAAEALKFVKWLTEPAQQQVFMDQVPLIPSNPAALKGQQLSPQIAGFTTLVDQLQIVPTPWKAQVYEALTKGAQSLVLKEKTVDQVLNDLESAQAAG